VLHHSKQVLRSEVLRRRQALLHVGNDLLHAFRAWRAHRVHRRAPMHFLRLSLFLPLAGLLAVVAHPAAAHAEDAPATAPRTEMGANVGDRGFELMLRPAYGSAGTDSPIRVEPQPGLDTGALGGVYAGKASPYGGGFIGDLSAGFRFNKWISAGLAGGYRASAAKEVEDGTGDLSRSAFHVGPYVRAYLPVIANFDPWVSAGVAYMKDTQSYRYLVSGVAADVKLSHHGVAIPLAIGLDYRVLPNFAVGPSFSYSIVTGAGGCATLSAPGYKTNSYCTDGSPKVTDAKTYGVWSVGLDLRVTL
jgi:hypothetical protein